MKVLNFGETNNEYIQGLGVGVVVGFFATTFLFGWIVHINVNNKWRSEIIQRDLAQYCPDNGEWAWKGECK